ncbi:MAG: hypothetical protein H6727_10520 [Myxococcales bacterium]|nr:hypothetical protein [Myxococcales bacterium]
MAQQPPPSRATRKRFISQNRLNQEQAMWLCRAILTHYRTDGSQAEGELQQVAFPNHTLRSQGYKRGRDWVMHPVGYDLKETFYGTQKSGIRVAWAGLASLPILQKATAPEDFRTYNLYGLSGNSKLSIAVYRITEVVATSRDENFILYVKQCFQRIQDDVEEVPEYSAKKEKPLTLRREAEINR